MPKSKNNQKTFSMIDEEISTVTETFENKEDTEKSVNITEQMFFEERSITVTQVSVLCFDPTADPFYRKIRFVRGSKKLREYKIEDFIPTTKLEKSKQQQQPLGEVLDQVDVPVKNGFKINLAEQGIKLSVPAETTIIVVLHYKEAEDATPGSNEKD